MTGTVRMAEPRNADTRGMAAGAVPILVVDDDPAKRLALKAVLAPLGHSVVEADSGVAALRCVKAQDFAVILLDVRMPIMDGLSTAALIRRRRQSEMTPIIFITAHTGDEAATTDPYAAGAVDFIFAPIVPDELRAKVSVFAGLFSRAEALATQAREVQASADQLRLLTDAAPIGIFQTDIDDRYVYTNPRWTQITGLRAEEAIGRKWDCIIDSEQRAGLVTDGADGMTGSELSCRFEIRRPGVATCSVLATSKPIPDIEGGITGWVGTLADVTTEVWAEAAMAEARDEATEASRLKSDFLANMSHEIRTPMNGVIGMTELLLETDLDDRQRDYAQTVRTSGEALLSIINDILDFSKIEAGKLEVEEIEFEPRSVVDDVVALLAGPATAKGLELIAVVDGSVPAVAYGDPGRVRQVLTNLIANAVKFTEAGEVVVRVDGTEVVGSQTTLRFTVCDTGDGIAPEKLDTIFQPFVQADTSTSRKYGGTGLGLAISGQLVELMGGDWGVSSRLGEGSTFWFTIGVPADSAPTTGRQPHCDSDLAGLSALVVDANATQRSVLSAYLSEWGMAVSTADSAPNALAALRAAVGEGRSATVALVDQRVGLDLIEAIGLSPGLAGTAVVLMTGLGQVPDAEPVRGEVLMSVSKPIHKEELRSCLKAALGLHVMEPAPTVRPEPIVAWDASHTRGRLLLAEDNVINQKVAVAILTGAGYSVDTVVNGAEAVVAVATRPYDAVLMDCQMPELNGYEATAAIRAQEGVLSRVPIIAMTAGARREDKERCLAEGMDSYLAKPISKDALLSLVARSVTMVRH